MNNEKLLYYYICFFMIYSFLGWCIEVIYATIKTRKFVNRGFLNGPLCPIYGFGVVIIVALLGKFKENTIQLFIYSTILVSTLEYIVGFVLEKLFHHKWWDYSNMKFNLGGYISLVFSLLWGGGCVVILKYIQPIIEGLVYKLPIIIGYPIIIVLVICLIIDTVMTVLSINGLNKRLRRLEEIAIKLKHISDELGENIYDKTTSLLDKNDKLRVKLENKRANKLELLEEQNDILREKKSIHNRLLKAFPKMRSTKFSNALEKLREYREENR